MGGENHRGSLIHDMGYSDKAQRTGKFSDNAVSQRYVFLSQHGL